MNISARFVNLFLCIAGLLLGFTGLLKCYDGFHSRSGMLSVVDPVLAMPYRLLFRLAGPFEIMLSICILASGMRMRYKLLVVQSTSLCFLLYHVIAYLTVEQTSYCPCLGSLTQILPFSSQFWERCSCFLSSALFVGSTVLIREEFKFNAECERG